MMRYENETTNWAAFKVATLGEDIPDKELDAHHLAQLHSRVEQMRRYTPNGDKVR